MVAPSAAERDLLATRAPGREAVIALHIGSLDRLFHSLDPAPFYDKHLDPEAERYIVDSAKELRPHRPTAIVIHVDQLAGDPDAARGIGEAIHMHFARCSRHLRRELRDLLGNGWVSLVIGLTCLGGSVVGGEAIARRMEESPLATVLRESLLIGGWVAMWKPIEVFLYEWWPLLRERRLTDRLSRLPVGIVDRSAAGPWIAGPVRLENRATGRAVGEVSGAELAMLLDSVPAAPGATGCRVTPAAVDDLASRPGATTHLVSLLRSALGGGAGAVDIGVADGARSERA